MTDSDNNSTHETTSPSPPEELTSADQSEVITPLKVTISKNRGIPLRRAHTYKVPFVLIGVSFMVVLIGGLWLIYYLARNPMLKPPVLTEEVTPPLQSQSMVAETPVSETDEVQDPIEVAREKENAEQKLGDFLLAKQELETRGVSEWGGELCDRMMAFSKAADVSLMNKEYQSAAENYQEALALARELSDGTDDALQRLLNEGKLALTKGDGERAQDLFDVALMIDPENSFARHNLERAKNSKKVVQLIASGKDHENNNNLALALTDYQEALRLDPESEEAQSALNLITKVISDEQFQKLMSEGLSALHRGDYKHARSLFLKAQSFKPDSREVNDALSQVDASIQLASIEELRIKALAAEKAEKWDQALDSYRAVLKIYGTIQFALEGQERSQKRQQMAERMQNYLEKPYLLESDGTLTEAILLLKKAEAFEPKGSRFKEQLRRLHDLIAVAQTTVPVTIESDGLTEVIIYKVGKLGSFYSKEVNLRPGTYTIVGSRDGFKDVRQRLKVKAGQNELRVTLKCSEEI